MENGKKVHKPVHDKIDNDTIDKIDSDITIQPKKRDETVANNCTKYPKVRNTQSVGTEASTINKTRGDILT